MTSWPPRRSFATTRWTMVMTAVRDASPGAAAALEELCALYWPPLYAYARRQGHAAEQAQDLTQAFFARLVEKQSLSAADPRRGKFRSFLLASFKHFMANEWHREHALKRGGTAPHVALEFETAEARYAAEPRHALTPDLVFEREWASGVLDRATAALRAELAAAGKETAYEHLEPFLAGERAPGGYAEAARRLGTTEGAARVMVHRLRRRYRDLLRAEIAPTVSDDAEIDDEIRHLTSVLARPPSS